MIKDTTTKFSSKLIAQEKHITSLTTYSEERLERVSVSNRVGNKIDAVKMKIKTKNANKISDIQADNTIKMTTLEMKLFSTISIQPSSSDQIHTDQLKWMRLQLSENSTHISQFTKNQAPLTKNIIQYYWVTKTKEDIKIQKSIFPTDTLFENGPFIVTPLIGDEFKQLESKNLGSLNHWVGCLMNITVQTRYGLQYFTTLLSGYMNAPTEPALFAL